MFALRTTASARLAPRVLLPATRGFSLSAPVFQSAPQDKKLVELGLTEDQQDLPKELVSGAPLELVTEREVRIYKEAKTAMQSGHHNGKYWRIDWDVLSKGNRWENDLIGYQGSADYMQATSLKFDTLEAAIRFAKGQGYSYYVQEPKKRHFRQKDYSSNFLWSPTKLKHIRTK